MAEPYLPSYSHWQRRKFHNCVIRHELPILQSCFVEVKAKVNGEWRRRMSVRWGKKVCCIGEENAGHFPTSHYSSGEKWITNSRDDDDQLSGSNINPLHREAPFVELRLMEEWEIINTFERIFDSKDVSNKVKVKSISMELKRRASDWWELVGTDQGYP